MALSGSRGGRVEGPGFNYSTHEARNACEGRSGDDFVTFRSIRELMSFYSLRS